MNISEAVREFPIECLIQKARDNFYSRLPEEPPEESLLNFRSLLAASEKALETILAVDSKVRDLNDWLAAVDVVEEIRDEALEMIEVLQISYNRFISELRPAIIEISKKQGDIRTAQNKEKRKQ